MIKELLKAEVPIRFEPKHLQEYRLVLPDIDPTTGQPNGHPDARYYDGTGGRLENIAKSREGDVRSPIRDVTKGGPSRWWLIELFPVKAIRQKPGGPEIWTSDGPTSEEILR